MKLRRLTTLGILGYASYKLYQNRDYLKVLWREVQNSKEDMSKDVDRIKQSLATIQEQREILQDINQDLTYKLKIFRQEVDPRLAEIQNRFERLNKQNTK